MDQKAIGSSSEGSAVSPPGKGHWRYFGQAHETWRTNVSIMSMLLDHTVVMVQRQMEKAIWTIGHSTRTRREFIAALRSFHIEVLADVRRFPGSKKYPQFNVDVLKQYLPESGISYLPQPALGGRRKPRPDSDNMMWRNESFRGYADYAETEDFRSALNELKDAAFHGRVAYMCSEAVWWRGHRAIISVNLKANGW